MFHPYYYMLGTSVKIQLTTVMGNIMLLFTCPISANYCPACPGCRMHGGTMRHFVLPAAGTAGQTPIGV